MIFSGLNKMQFIKLLFIIENLLTYFNNIGKSQKTNPFRKLTFPKFQETYIKLFEYTARWEEKWHSSKICCLR